MDERMDEGMDKDGGLTGYAEQDSDDGYMGGLTGWISDAYGKMGRGMDRNSKMDG